MDKIKNYLPINFAILSNPVNWVLVTLMVALAGVALTFVFNSSQGNKNGS